MAVGNMLDLVNDIADSRPSFVTAASGMRRGNCPGDIGYQFLDSLTGYRDGGNDRDSQEPSQLIQVNINAAVFGIIPHIQSDYYRDAFLQQLQGQVKVSLQIGGI